MKEIKFTTNYEPVLSFSDWNFKTKYEERVGNNPGYIQIVHGEAKHLALCPRCNNPVAILGVYKKINVAPHARHAKGVNIPNVVQYDEYKFQKCPYHNKRANYIKEYVDETDLLAAKGNGDLYYACYGRNSCRKLCRQKSL